MTVTNVSQKKPDLILEQYFLGKTFASGIFEDRFGNLRRQFRVNLHGIVSGNRLVLDEQFLYEDGEKAQRVFSLHGCALEPYA